MTRFRFFLSVAALGLATAGSAACTNHTVLVTAAKPVVTFDTTCAKTACEALRERSPRTQQCEDCTNTVTEGCLNDVALCSDIDLCTDACRPAACADPTACAEYKWVARVGGLTATPGVEEACLDAHTTLLTRCGAPMPTDQDLAKAKARCENAALVSTNAATDAYACSATADCDTSQAHCYSASSFGDELCATRAASCGTGCGDDERAVLNDLGSYLKPEILAAARTCAQQTSCDQATACMEAWSTIFE